MYVCPAEKELSYRFTGSERGMNMRKYFLDLMTCRACNLKPKCTNSPGVRRISRWEHQGSIDQMNDLMSDRPETTLIRKQTVEHPYGTIKCWMGATHFLTKRLLNVSTEMSLHVLAYNLRRMISILGPVNSIAAIRA